MTSILSYIGMIACAIAIGISISTVALHRKHKTNERRWLPPKVLAAFFWVILSWLLEKVTRNGYTLTEAIEWEICLTRISSHHRHLSN